MCVDEIKLVGKKQNINPTWKFFMKDVDRGEPTSFLDHVYSGCTQRECQISKDIVDNYRSMFESGISGGAMEKLPETTATGTLDAETISSWSYDIEGHAKKCVDDIANLRIKQLNNYTKSRRHAWMTMNLRRRIEIRGRIVKSMLSNCSEMLILGTYWKTCYSMVSE